MALAVTAMTLMPEIAKSIQAAVNPTIHKEDDGVFITCNLAKSMGNLADHYKQMDEKMKVMIGVSLKLLSGIPEKELKETGAWSKVKECFLNNPCLVPLENEDVENYRTMQRSSSQWFASGTTEADEESPEVAEAETWIKELISDEDVIANLSFDPKCYAKLISCTGVALNKLKESSFVSREKHFKKVVDIGVLRFPDLDNPYFKVYRLSLKAYRDCTQSLVFEWNKSGLIGEFNSRKFGIREEFVKDIKKETKEKAMNMVDNLF